MFGIIDYNKKFILLDSDRDRLRTTALMLAHEETVIVTDYDEDGNEIGQHEELQFVPTYTEETVDEAIVEYAEADIETACNGEKYLKGYATQPTEYEKAQARISVLKAEIASVDYKQFKYLRGELTAEEWEQTKAYIQARTTEINELEKIKE